MTMDRVRIPGAYLDPGMGTVPLHPMEFVSASMMHAHLAKTHGIEVPHDTRLREITDMVFAAITKYSTDEALDRFREGGDTGGYLGHFVELVRPMVTTTGALGEDVGRRLTDIETGVTRRTRPQLKDLAYGIGLFHGATVINCGILDTPHPRTSGQATASTTPGYRPMAPSTDQSPSYLRRLLAFELRYEDHRNTIAELQYTAREHGTRAETFLGRWSVIATDME